jgi:hypothetical protein
VLFEAPKWEFSYPLNGKSYCAVKAEESPFIVWDPATPKREDYEYGHSPLVELSQQEELKKEPPQQSRWDKTPNQHVSINVHLTEEGKRAFKETVLGKVENKHSKPPVNSDDCVKDMYALLLEYVETFPREIELRDRAYPLLNRVYEDFITKETAKKQETFCFIDALCEAHMCQGHSLPNVITNGEYVVRCQDASIEHPTHFILFKNKECIAICYHPVEITEKHIDLSKGWCPASEDVTRWARSQSLSGLIDKLKSSKKQEESTALFDVMADAIFTHYSASRNITLKSGNVIAIYYINKCPRWKITTWKPLVEGDLLGEANTVQGVEEIANHHNVDLSRGWYLANFS